MNQRCAARPGAAAADLPLGMFDLRRSRRALLAAGMASVLLVNAPARADEPSNGPGWTYGGGYGEAVLAAASFASLSLNLVPPRHSNLGPDAAHAADQGYGTASYATAFVLPAVTLLIGSGVESELWSGLGAGSPEARANRAVLIQLESFALAEGMTGGLKAAVGRCRPFAWNGQACKPSDKDNFAAFPSGHTSGVSALAGTNLVLAIRSHGRLARLRWATFLLTEIAALATAALRVGAGAHSWTDVLGGWAIGHGAGMGVAFLHPMETPPSRPMGTPGP